MFNYLNAAVEDPATNPGAYRYTGLNSFYTLAINIFMGVSFSIAFLTISMAGVSYITSQGDPKGLESAKAQLTSGIIGLLLGLAAFAIKAIFFTSLGVTTVNLINDVPL